LIPGLRRTIYEGVVTDPAEVFRLGSAKAKENLAFRRYLSAHHIGETVFQILASDIQQQIDCTSCANCCRYSVVPVSKPEVERIAAHLGVTEETAVRLYTVPDPDAPGSRILLNSSKGCAFLDGNLCTIYEARPKACRDFPHVAVGVHSLGARPSSQGRWAPLCPIIYNALEALKRVTGYHPHPAANPSPEPQP
jgi:Fe-S-cluster containining protein